MCEMVFCPKWARGERRTKISLVTKQNRKGVFRMGGDWKIEEPDPIGSTERWRTMYALWKHERVLGSAVKRWMFDRLLTRQEAELYGRAKDEVR